MRLLLATSDHQLHTTLARLLHRANYLFDSVTTAADTLAYAETGEYDGLLLDNTLAEDDSLAIIAQLRQEHIATPALLFAQPSSQLWTPEPTTVSQSPSQTPNFSPTCAPFCAVAPPTPPTSFPLTD